MGLFQRCILSEWELAKLMVGNILPRMGIEKSLRER